MAANVTEQRELDRLVTPQMLAERWGLPVKRIRRAVQEGRLPAFQLGAWIRIRLADAEQWLHEHRYEPPDR